MKKMTAIKISVIVFLVLSMSASLKVNAQFDGLFTHYANNEMFINPAYTGTKDALYVTALHRQQWVGIEGRPVTTTFTMHSPVWEDKMGLGLSLLSEKLGVTKRDLLYLSYSFRVKTSSIGYLGFGIMGGMHIQSDDFASVATDQPNDPWFSTNIENRTAPNFGFGINYYTDKFFTGISIPRLIDDNYMFGDDGKPVNDLKFKPKYFHYYLTIGRVFTVNDNFKLRPTAMIKTVFNVPLQYDISLNSLIKEHLWLGASYRSKADMSGLIGIQVNPRFLVSYSYDFTASTLNHFTNGSHEILLSMLFGYKGKKIAATRYF